MKLSVLVSVLCVVVGVGLGHDVSLDTIAGITATVDSGQTVVPAPILATNSGGGPGEVYLKILRHGDLVHFDSIEFPQFTRKCTLALSEWIPLDRESLDAVAWLVWEGDTNPANDTFRLKFFVRVRDVAVVQIFAPPPDTIYDSGAVFYPYCKVWNFGNVSATFDVRFRIGGYLSTRNISLVPGGGRSVTADPYTAMPGIWACQVSAVVTGDMHPENNVLADTFTVRGALVKDAAVKALLSPPIVVDTTMTITPKGRVVNNGVDPATFEAYYFVYNAVGTPVYADSAPVTLNPGDSSDVAFTNVRFTTPGSFSVACSVYMAGDQNSTNNVVRRSLRVVEEGVIYGDLGVVEILWPTYLPPDSARAPVAVWKNFTTDRPMDFRASLTIVNKHGAIVYSQSREVAGLAAGEETTLVFEEFNVGTDTGMWHIRCSTYAVGDTNPPNDTLGAVFYVLYPGIEEVMNDECGAMSIATVVRGVLFLPASGAWRKANGGLLDISGRRVLALRPGANDVTILPAGVYFLRAESPVTGRGATAVRKIVIQP